VLPLADGVVRLRAWSPADADELVRCCNDPDVRRFLPPIPIPFTRADADEFIEANRPVPDGRSGFALAIEWDGVPLAGGTGIRLLEPGLCQFGYWVAPEARGRGIATRALRLFATWALDEAGVERAQLFTDPANPISQRVAERAGFQREALLRSFYLLRGERRDAVMFSRLPGDR
jgi:RimJ/RimL family protein N-acetyltransferase